MENASKALIIAGAIILSILIIAIGIYIFNSAQTQIDSSIQGMNTQEKEAFNNQFTVYQGEQSGSNVKALITRLVGNFNTYADEPAKVPTVTGLNNVVNGFTNTSYTNVNPNDNTYVSNLSTLRNGIINKHIYEVTFDFGVSGLVENINIEDVTNN